MDRAEQIALLEELAGLRDAGAFFLDDKVQPSPVARYTDPDRFAQEQALFRTRPLPVAHVSELTNPGDFLTRDLVGLPLLLARDKDGQLNAFLNVCRHRGARLVGDASGCRNSFTCPYHGWTWSNSGALRGVPHQASGFPDLDRAAHGLKRLPMIERFGLIWVIPNPAADPDFDAHLDPLAADFDWLALDTHVIYASDTLTRTANWKLLLEGGLEAYHFKVAHKDTIGPHFVDNLSSYKGFGDHLRSILPRSSFETLQNTDRATWDIRDHANVLYTVFPLDQFLLLQDHIAWISLNPLATGQTGMRLSMFVPAAEMTDANAEHWARNHKITHVTLDEDFAINEAVQAGLSSGANDALTFGRYEGALAAFNATVEAHL